MMHFQIQWYDRLPSTNTFLKERLELEPELPSGTVVVAREQTHGRGRRNREWLSDANENLTFSLLLRGDMEPKSLPSAAMAAAVAVSETLEMEGIHSHLKWPNDVLTGGKKICGILSEGIPGGIIIGIGLNVNMERTGHIDQPATSLLMETGERRSLDKVLEKLLLHLSAQLEPWAQSGFSGIREAWESKVSNLGNPVVVQDGTMERTGLLAGFGDDGELLLQSGDGIVSPVWAGDLSR